MNRKQAEKWICENTKLAWWNKYTQKPHPLSNAYHVKLKSLMEQKDEGD